MTRSCPWYVSASAVRRYMAITGDGDFDAASDALIAYCAGVDLAQEPRRKSEDAVIYRGPPPLRLELVVVTTTRPEGPLPQLVEVRTRQGTRANDKASPSALRRRAARAHLQRLEEPPVDAERMAAESSAGRVDQERLRVLTLDLRRRLDAIDDAVAEAQDLLGEIEDAAGAGAGGRRAYR